MLEAIIKSQIRERGAMDVGEYMDLVLSHPKHGYYMKKDPFGAHGDFTTAPEISQMFGEMIAAWIIDTWKKIGSPKRWVLLECGAGRGTMMADILRVFDKFDVPCQPYLWEISPVLCASQKSRAPNAIWIDSSSELPKDIPVIAIGNEFLDALPFRQLQRVGDIWMERFVSLNNAGELCFSLKPYNDDAPNISVNDGDIFEFSPAREDTIAELREIASAGLFIDYGHMSAGVGDTFQAVYKHGYVGVFEHIGDADLTSHVDFSVFKNVYLVEQGAFLKALGIEARADALRPKAPSDIDKALHRLIDDDKMGKLFKVMGFVRDENIQLAGF